MAKRKKSSISGTIPSRIPITNILSVSRQPQVQRLPSDAENIDNALVTLEHNIEKRSGFAVVPPYNLPSLTNGDWDFTNANTKINLESLTSIQNSDIWYYWYSINDDNRFLVAINFEATGPSQTLVYTYKINPEGTWKDVTSKTQWDPLDPATASGNQDIINYAAAQSPTISYPAARALGTIVKESRAYLTHNPNNKTAKESLKAVTLGSNIVVLNSNVYAGISSDEEGFLFDLNGVVTATPDIKGRKVTYYTSTKVIKVFDPGEDGVLNTEDDIELGYKTDSNSSGTFVSTTSTSAILETPQELHSAILKAGSSSISLILADTASSIDDYYNGLTIEVKPTLASSSKATAEIVDYVGASRTAYVKSKDSISGLIFSSDISGSSGVYKIGIQSVMELANPNILQTLIGKSLVVNGEYRVISNAVSNLGFIDVYTWQPFSSPPPDNASWLAISNFKSYIGPTSTSNIQIHLGQYAYNSDWNVSPYTPLEGRRLFLNGKFYTITDVVSVDATGTQVQVQPTFAANEIPVQGTTYEIFDGIGYSGLLKGGSTTTVINLTRPAPFNTTSFAMCSLTIGTTKSISSYNTATNAVTITPAFSSAPAGGVGVQIAPFSTAYYSIKVSNPLEASYVGSKIYIISGPGTGQEAFIFSYDSTTRTITVVNWGGTTPNNTSTYAISTPLSEYISVTDYSYYNPELPFLGQRVTDASIIKLPPEEDDWYGNNSKNDLASPDNNARTMLTALYDEDHPFKEEVNGRGKIYFTVSSYLNLSSGFYRTINFKEGVSHTVVGTSPAESVIGSGRPYLQKIRTPEKWSYIDPLRMPQRLSFDFDAQGNHRWNMQPMSWTPRDSGDNKSNPGPSIFKTTDGKKLKHVQLSALSVFKNRLWFSSEDVVFSSQTGEYENFFIDDPTHLVDTDPIDIRASSNTFAEITSLTPFEDYLFVNTKADIQFQLLSSNQNQGFDLSITPFNVVLSPSTYYAAAAVVDPQLLGSQLYFFDKRRLYLFTGKNNLGFNSAVEVSTPVKNYLPENFRTVCVANAHNTLLMVDDDHDSHIYLYTIRFSGERVIQNSFYRFKLNEESHILSIQAYGNYVYMLVRIGDVENNETKFYVQRILLQQEELNVPRLDNLFSLKLETGGAHPNTTYNTILNETTIKLPDANIFTKHISGSFSEGLYLILGDPWIEPQTSTFTGSITGNVLTVTNNAGGFKLGVGSVISGSGIVGSRLILQEITGTGYEGTYLIDDSFTIPSQLFTVTINEDLAGTAFTNFKLTEVGNTVEVVLLGKFDHDGGTVYLGSTFLTNIELSQLFVRVPETGVPAPGIVGIRSLRVNHHNTGNYDVVVSNYKRSPIVRSFSAPITSFTFGEDTLPLSSIEENGKFITKIFGFNESSTISLQSAYFTPMNIASLEFFGKLKIRNSLVN